MSVTVKYFASLREELGQAEVRLESRPGETVATLWIRANPERSLPPNVLAAVNQEYVGRGHPVVEGDEVAFFPPVTGG